MSDSSLSAGFSEAEIAEGEARTFTDAELQRLRSSLAGLVARLTATPDAGNDDAGRLIEVEWADSERVELGWAAAEEYIAALNERRVYRTAGYFIGETEAGVMVSHSRSEDNGTFNAAMVIPAAAVLARRWLHEKEPHP